MNGCQSDAECHFNKALIREQADRIAKLEIVIVHLMGQEMGQEVLQIINTWPLGAIGDKSSEAKITEKEVEHETRK